MTKPRPSGPTPRVLPELSTGAALWRGVVTSLVLVVPAAVINQLIVDDHKGVSPWAMLMWVVILLGGAAGGWAVIRLSRDAPLAWAAAASAIAYLLVQIAGVIKRLIEGGTISWLGYPFLALLMATCGMLGGMFARGWQRDSDKDSANNPPSKDR